MYFFLEGTQTFTRSIGDCPSALRQALAGDRVDGDLVGAPPSEFGRVDGPRRRSETPKV